MHNALQLKFVTILVIMLSTHYVHASCVGIGCSCTISSTATVAFGTYNPISGSSLAGTGSISVTCSALVVGLNVSYVIALNAGLYGTLAARKMNYLTSYLPYNLYTTSGYTTVWGDGTAGTSTVSDSYLLSLLSHTVTYTVYGLISASQNVIAGSYTDTITVTVTY
jgi:spore coat protein U-like protein